MGKSRYHLPGNFWQAEVGKHENGFNIQKTENDRLFLKMGHSLWGFKASPTFGRGLCGHCYLAISSWGWACCRSSPFLCAFWELPVWKWVNDLFKRSKRRGPEMQQRWGTTVPVIRALGTDKLTLDRRGQVCLAQGAGGGGVNYSRKRWGSWLRMSPFIG